MPINSLDVTTHPTASLMQRLTFLEQRCADLERSRRGIGTLIAGTYAEAVAQLPESGSDGTMILGRGGFNPTLFVFDAGEKGEGAWYAIKATEA
jgi:hypothetical protein